MTAVSSPAICVVMPATGTEGLHCKMHKSRSTTSLLADLIATEDTSEATTTYFGGNETPGLTSTLNLASPKTMLHDLLGDFFIDADALQKKELLGEGGFAVVHRCLYRDTLKGETLSVAMKELKPDLLASVDDLREFVMEASLQRKLHHSNIVRILGIGATDCTSMHTMRRSMFILQEYVPGKSLKDMVIQQMCHRNERIYTMKRAIGWLLDVACALHYLHEVCRPMIVHRDLKLDNILLSQNGKLAKLCDFGLHKRIRTVGIAPNLNEVMDDSYYGGALYQSLMDRVVEDEPSQDSGEKSLTSWTSHFRDLTLSTQLSLLGTNPRSSQSWRSYPSDRTKEDESTFSERPVRDPHKAGFTGKVGSVVYMAPEVFKNQPYNEKVDVFSFAVMMYELLAETNIAVKTGMLEKGELGNYAERVAQGFREPIPEKWPDYVKMLVTECWDQNPDNRPSFKDITHRLTCILDSGMAEKMGRPLINMNALPIRCCCIQ